MFRGKLERKPQTCRTCDCLHKEIRKQYVDGEYREVIYYRCFGVSEPPLLSLYDLDRPCKEYPDSTSQVEFSSMREFVDLLDDDEIKELGYALKR